MTVGALACFALRMVAVWHHWNLPSRRTLRSVTRAGTFRRFESSRDIHPKAVGVGEPMPTNVNRRTVDLSQYPGLVVIYLGMRVNRMAGLKTLAGFGPRISDLGRGAAGRTAVARELRLFPVPNACRYASILAGNGVASLRGRALSRIASGGRTFLRNSGGTGFWHETYLMQGGMEAIYDDVIAADWLSAFRAYPSGARHHVRCSSPRTE